MIADIVVEYCVRYWRGLVSASIEHECAFFGGLVHGKRNQRAEESVEKKE
jgi:hypothetical protein